MLGVTLFGIFLTPVFFYVILGLGQTRLFRARTTQAVVSYATGALLGGVVGFSLAELHVGRQPWGPLVGAVTGILIVRAARALLSQRLATRGLAAAKRERGDH
jgi:multidrug efflux pump